MNTGTNSTETSGNAAPSFVTALYGFLGTTFAATAVMFFISSV